MVLPADYQGMASAALVIREAKHIDVYLQLIIVNIDIVFRDGVRQSVKMVALKHFFFIKSSSNAIAIPFWESGSFKQGQNCVAKTALILVLDVYFCFLLC